MHPGKSFLRDSQLPTSQGLEKLHVYFIWIFLTLLSDLIRLIRQSLHHESNALIYRDTSKRQNLKDFSLKSCFTWSAWNQIIQLESNLTNDPQDRENTIEWIPQPVVTCECDFILKYESLQQISNQESCIEKIYLISFFREVIIFSPSSN